MRMCAYKHDKRPFLADITIILHFFLRLLDFYLDMWKYLLIFAH